ncbi:hypothetical protein [Bordetella sp. N]|uniref:hypothetical protein n=1 Tax=Bordetella sp. N TaxID=1746199 RepID=UPI0009E74165
MDTIKTEAEIAKLMAETSKLNVEASKMMAETSKLNAEASKMIRERAWYPMILIAAAFASGAALAKLLTG